MTFRKTEVALLVKLLEQDWESADALAKALISALDKDRADRTSYVAVMQFGGGGNGKPGMTGPVWYSAIGPYPGAASAKRAVLSDPGASMATVIAVIPVTSPEGLAIKLREVG